MTEKNLVLKYRLMNTVTASFNITVRQMTEMSQQKNRSVLCYVCIRTSLPATALFDGSVYFAASNKIKLR